MKNIIIVAALLVTASFFERPEDHSFKTLQPDVSFVEKTDLQESVSGDHATPDAARHAAPGIGKKSTRSIHI